MENVHRTDSDLFIMIGFKKLQAYYKAQGSFRFKKYAGTFTEYKSKCKSSIHRYYL